MKSIATLAIALVIVGTESAAAQSIFASRGLGVPVAPVDARTRVLGGVGVGLRDRNPSLINPAEVAGYRFRGVTAALQTSDRTMALDGATADAGTSRFPLLQVIYPVSQRLVLSAGYGGFLDQTWSVFADRTEVVGSDTVAVRDAIDSSGGIAQVQGAAAFMLSPELALGVAAGLYNGQLDRSLSRTFTDGSLPGVQPIQTQQSWSQRAPFASVGLSWDLASVLRVGGSVTWAGTLKANSNDESVQDFQLDLPLQVAGGVSTLLAPNLLGAVSGRWSGWSRGTTTAASVDSPVDTWEIGGGLEWDGSTLGDRSLPLRIGYHYAQYPFQVDGVTPSESAWALGAGIRFGLSAAGPLATLDTAVERGTRDAPGAGIAEDFWRMTISLAVFGR